jgi:hypothetical protein
VKMGENIVAPERVVQAAMMRLHVPPVPANTPRSSNTMSKPIARPAAQEIRHRSRLAYRVRN